MKHLELKINNDNPKTIAIDLVDNWNELSPMQLRYVALNWQAWQFMLQQGASMQYARTKLFVALIIGKNNCEIKEICNLLACIDYEETDYNILDTVNFIFEKNTLTKNAFPIIKPRVWFKLYGPADMLSNICIDEFSFALNFYNQYNKSNLTEHLNAFIACLYRRSHKNFNVTGDKRKPFNAMLIDQDLYYVKSMSFAHKQAVLLFFYGCLEAFSKIFHFVFERVENETASTNRTFLDVILMISGTKFGNFDETKQQNAFIVLKELNNLIEESKKQT